MATIAQITALMDQITTGGRNTVVETNAVWNMIIGEVFKMNRIEMIYMTPTEILANFNSTGLGIGDSVGFAICNGQNLTQDYRRRSPIGYDSAAFVSGFDYSIISNIFGEEKHTLTIPEMPAHHHGEVRNVAGAGAGGSGTFDFGAANTSDTGGNQAHNNVHPSKVTLFIQRIS